MKICSNCVLPETFPGIKFNEKGTCNYCVESKSIKEQNSKKAEYLKRFELLIKEYQGKSSYDALMCYSGGKDSTYTLAVLKEKYDLNILALTFDNGFLPDQTRTNILNVTDALKIDHLLLKPRFDVLAKVFMYCAEHDVYPAKALERSSAICTSCMGIIKYAALRLALEKDIPMIFYGWSPGQVPITASIMKNVPQMVKQMQKTVYGPIYQIVGDAIRPYFLEDAHFNGSYNFPFNIYPLAFIDYDIEAIKKDIVRLGWKRPEEVDANSTNCLLNSYGNFIHRQRLCFHPYAFELANLVRSGNLDRATALERLSEPDAPDTIAMVKEKLSNAENIFGK
jgi:hypothetical protein